MRFRRTNSVRDRNSDEVFGICVEGIKVEVGLQSAGTLLLALHFLWIDWGTQQVKL